ncbi:MAG: DNA polymerase III subunit delta' [Actinomycetota bacterium]
MSVWDYLEGSRAAEGLAAQMSSGEVAHSWLLLGPAGSGKRPAALAMAAALNCPEAPGIGCGVCSTCSRILRSRFPDVHHVVPEGPLIPVDVIRETVIPEAARSPFEGARKVFIIEEADRMNPSAQNALLKTLEEPHEDTVFILVSDHEEELLETIRSRCRTVRLEPVSESRIVELLVKHGTPGEVAVLAARLSEGDYERARAFAVDPTARERRALWVSIPARLLSPGDALDAAAEIVDRARDALKDREATQKSEVVELAEAMGQGRGTAAARNALNTRHRRELRMLEQEVIGEALRALASFYRDVLVLRRGGGEAITNSDLVDALEAWAGSTVSDTALVSAMERCVEARAALARNANVQLAVEATLVELSGLVTPAVAAH